MESQVIENKKKKGAKVCKCGTKAIYSNKHDAEYCEHCDKWLINKCSDINCEYCSTRADKPSETVNGA